MSNNGEINLNRRTLLNTLDRFALYAYPLFFFSKRHFFFFVAVSSLFFNELSSLLLVHDLGKSSPRIFWWDFPLLFHQISHLVVGGCCQILLNPFLFFFYLISINVEIFLYVNNCQYLI